MGPTNTNQPSLSACRDHCASHVAGYFAFSSTNRCACYNLEAGCPEDDEFGHYNAYRINYPEEIDVTIEEGKWHFSGFVEEESGLTGTLRRFEGVVQDGGHFTLSNVAVLEFADDAVFNLRETSQQANSMMFGVVTLFPDAPSIFQKTFNIMMECEDDVCGTTIPYGQTIDACDIMTIADAGNGQVGMKEKLIRKGLTPFFGQASGFRAVAAKFAYYAMQTKTFLNDKTRMGDDHDLGGGCEGMLNSAATFLSWVTSGESDRIFDLGDLVDGLVDFLDNSLGQLTFGVDLDITGRILTDEQMESGNLPFEVSVDNLHIVIDNGDQCTGNIVCGVLVALGEAFPGATGHEDSVLGCTLFEFVFELDREDWRSGNGIDYNCLRHTGFDDIKQNILDRAEHIWNTIKNAPGIRDYGEHGHLCFHDDHCKQDGDVCTVGLCYPKRGHGEYCIRDGDCAKDDCLFFTCIEGHDGSMCNTDDDCDSRRCNLGEIPFRCREKEGWHSACAKDSDCASGDCLLFQCIDGRDGDLCNSNDDCDSGRCATDMTCRPRAGNGDWCAFHNDCRSGRCGVDFGCTDRARKGEMCLMDDDCRSRDCSWWFTCN